MEVIKNLSTEIPYDPANPLLGIYLKETKSVSQRDICTPTYISALFTIAKIWKKSICLLMNEWIKKININGILLSHKKE